MSYVDAFHDKDIIRVVERTEDGKRQFQVYPAEYTFYVDDPNGNYTTVYDSKVRKYTAKTKKQFLKEVKMANGRIWESDIKPVNRCLETFYSDAVPPNLHVAFFDIEVNFDAEKGFAPPEDPFNYITAITVYLQWVDQLITLAIPPKSMAMDVAQDIADKFDNTFMFSSEQDLLSTFLELIEDADILSGWNSEGFDIPYTVNRISRVLNKEDNRKWCLWNQMPKKRTYEAYGGERETFDLVGRVHLDYMKLYQKFTYHEMHSYSLDAIGEHEVQEQKIAYEGTLDTLYNQDFEKFIAYNRQDTYLIHKIDQKLDFISLASSVVHSNTSVMSKVFGAVAVTEQGIINETHKLGLIVPNRKREQETEFDQAAGAYVAYPKKGLHKWIGSIDINSLYPSALRALNMAPETIIGQVRQTDTNAMIHEHIDAAKKNTFTSAFEGKFSSLEYQYIMEKRPDTKVIIDWEQTGNTQTATMAKLGGASIELTAKEAYELIFESNQPWMISANGTIFTYEKKGIIPGLLESWYADRKVMQKTKGRFLDLSHGLELPDGFEDINVTGGVEPMRELDFDKLFECFENKDIHCAEKILDRYNVKVEDGKVIPDKKEIKLAVNYWDKLQLVRKISLNSLYGALLNAHCRFFDQRLGQSTTLSGRTIAKFMASYVNECITGEFDHTGEAIIYGDTDSTYFTAWPFVKDTDEEANWDADMATQLYDSISDSLNDNFPAAMQRAFHCPKEFGEIIQGGREITAKSGLFITKKRYAALVVDLEGERKDVEGKPGYLKAMGLDLKRSDTPVIVQDFLKDILMDLLTDVPQDDIFEKIRAFKTDFAKKPSWEKGSPKRANSITRHTAIYNKTKKCGVGHVKASIHYNTLRRVHHDNYSMEIQDGQKVIVCRLRDNPMSFKSIAYPTDEKQLPDWFKELPFDDNGMEDAVVDKKIENLFGVLNWNISDFTDTRSTFHSLFS
jgi:DNA polymerase elongation subunit (family B)